MIKAVLKKILPEGLLVHLQAANHYFYGEPEIRLIRHICPRGKLALDIGANIGTYTYFLSRYASQVYAYEPNPDLAERLKKLFPRASVRNAAVSNASGRLTLRIPVEDGRIQHELGSVAQPLEDSEVVVYEVPAITIDSEGLDNVGFIKIDAEQHEREVLHGALETIRNCRPTIMTEATPLLYASSLPETFRFVTDLDYEGWFTFESRHLPFTEFDPHVHANPEKFGISFMNTNIFLLPTDAPGISVLTA